MTLPRHVAIIMDGNGRWAKQRGLPRVAGHRAGEKAVRTCIEVASERQIEVLSLFAFSSENWSRPRTEVEFLMNLFLRVLKRERDNLVENDIQFHVIGDRSRLTSKLQHSIAEVEALTQYNSGLKLIAAVNYGGLWDISQAAKKLAQRVVDQQIQLDDINEQSIQDALSTADFVAPDLLIRTSGEHRISNFFLAQLAYTELYFSEKYWPDFDAAEFNLALQEYAHRERRFGQTQAKTEVA